MVCPKCTAKIPDGEHICKNCQTDVYTHHIKVSKESNVPLPMAWFKFVIYFLLFAGATMNLSSAGMYISGSAYYYMGEDYSQVVYDMYEGLQTIDVVVAILLIALAAFQIFVRFRLALFKADGPLMITFVYVFSIIINVFYILGFSLIVGGIADISENLISLGINIAMCIVNYIYFNNRKEMFKN